MLGEVFCFVPRDTVFRPSSVITHDTTMVTYRVVFKIHGRFGHWGYALQYDNRRRQAEVLDGMSEIASPQTSPCSSTLIMIYKGWPIRDD